MKVPLKQEYGPTLGQMLAPSWRRARGAVRVAAVLGGAVGTLALGALVASRLNVRYTHGGEVPFGFSYRGLHKAKPDVGGFVKLVRREDGRLADSYAVAPLSLAPYSGNQSGALPLAAASYERTLERRFDGFRFEGEGKTRIGSKLSGYGILYSVLVDGRRVHGRDVMLLPEREGQRRGVVVEMLSAQRANIAKPVASSGVLEKPLKSFSFR